MRENFNCAVTPEAVPRPHPATTMDLLLQMEIIVKLYNSVLSQEQWDSQAVDAQRTLSAKRHSSWETSQKKIQFL